MNKSQFKNSNIASLLYPYPLTAMSEASPTLPPPTPKKPALPLSSKVIDRLSDDDILTREQQSELATLLIQRNGLYVWDTGARILCALDADGTTRRTEVLLAAAPSSQNRYVCSKRIAIQRTITAVDGIANREGATHVLACDFLTNTSQDEWLCGMVQRFLSDTFVSPFPALPLPHYVGLWNTPESQQKLFSALDEAIAEKRAHLSASITFLLFALPHTTIAEEIAKPGKIIVVFIEYSKVA